MSDEFWCITSSFLTTSMHNNPCHICRYVTTRFLMNTMKSKIEEDIWFPQWTPCSLLHTPPHFLYFHKGRYSTSFVSKLWYGDGEWLKGAVKQRWWRHYCVLHYCFLIWNHQMVRGLQNDVTNCGGSIPTILMAKPNHSAALFWENWLCLMYGTLLCSWGTKCKGQTPLGWYQVQILCGCIHGTFSLT